ncbi:MAG: aspartate carbamoyltransferase, partial [Lachnospiraceae bacterium]|nr:aspartate carbamoyltransferase [Lachnospiraceae bacterium]
AVEVDDDPRACYFKQVLNGKYMRMALILMLLREAEKDPSKVLIHSPENAKHLRCANPRCICSVETGIEHVVIERDGRYVCAYCEQPV